MKKIVNGSIATNEDFDFSGKVCYYGSRATDFSIEIVVFNDCTLKRLHIGATELISGLTVKRKIYTNETITDESVLEMNIPVTYENDKVFFAATESEKFYYRFYRGDSLIIEVQLDAQGDIFVEVVGIAGGIMPEA